MAMQAIGSSPFPNPITTAFIADSAVTSAKINTVDGSKIVNASITPAKLTNFTQLKYVGEDASVASIGNSTTETTIGSVTIAASTVSSRILIFVNGRFDCITAGDYTTFRIKVGAAASEVTKFTYIIKPPIPDAHYALIGIISVPMIWHDSSETWTNELSVIVTAQNSDARLTTVSYCDNIIIIGA